MLATHRLGQALLRCKTGQRPLAKLGGSQRRIRPRYIYPRTGFNDLICARAHRAKYGGDL